MVPAVVATAIFLGFEVSLATHTGAFDQLVAKLIVHTVRLAVLSVRRPAESFPANVGAEPQALLRAGDPAPSGCVIVGCEIAGEVASTTVVPEPVVVAETICLLLFVARTAREADTGLPFTPVT
jgi:hypothetical protein